MIDHYLFLKKEYDNLDWNIINAFLEKYNILEFEKITRSIAFKLFDGDELDNQELEMFEAIINSGIFGNESVRLVNEISNMDVSSVEEAKRIIMWRRLFPPKKKMIADYRVLEKHRYLLPAMYAYRLIKAAFNFKKTKQEIDMINNSKN